MNAVNAVAEVPTFLAPKPCPCQEPFLPTLPCLGTRKSRGKPHSLISSNDGTSINASVAMINTEWFYGQSFAEVLHISPAEV
jgi:hypothetical protein